jgi:hypothetical protein
MTPEASPLRPVALHHRADGPALAGDTLHYGWPHRLGEVVTAIAQAGFTIESLTETRLLP